MHSGDKADIKVILLTLSHLSKNKDQHFVLLDLKFFMALCLCCAQFDRYFRLHAKAIACFTWLNIMPLIFWFLFIPAHVILCNIFCILYSTPYLLFIGRLSWWKMIYRSCSMVWRNMVYTSFFFSFFLWTGEGDIL